MSQILINDYLKQLDLIKRASGSSRETIVSARPPVNAPVSHFDVP